MLHYNLFCHCQLNLTHCTCWVYILYSMPLSKLLLIWNCRIYIWIGERNILNRIQPYNTRNKQNCRMWCWKPKSQFRHETKKSMPILSLPSQETLDEFQEFSPQFFSDDGWLPAVVPVRTVPCAHTVPESHIPVVNTCSNRCMYYTYYMIYWI
jgi:hypothetical protein